MIELVLAMMVGGLQDPPPALDGEWSVDLSTDPAEPYRKPMVLSLSPDGAVTGSFYDSDILAGRWKVQNGRTCASFRTTDGVGPYHTAVCRVGDHAEGQTWAEHRNFVFVWRAERVTDRSAAAAEADDLLRMFIQPAEWARTLSASGDPTAATDVRRAACVGLETRRMLCSWERRSGQTWETRSRYADFSVSDRVQLLTDPVS